MLRITPHLTITLLLAGGSASAEVTRFETEAVFTGRSGAGWLQDFSDFFDPEVGDRFSMRATAHRGRTLYAAGELEEVRGADEPEANTAAVAAVDARTGEVRWFHRSPILHDPGSKFGGYAQ